MRLVSLKVESCMHRKNAIVRMVLSDTLLIMYIYTHYA